MVVSLVLVGLVSDSARAATGLALFVPVSGQPAPEDMPGSSPARRVSVERVALTRLEREGGGGVQVPLPDGEQLTIDFRRAEILTSNAVVTATGDAGPRPVTPEVTIWRGRIAGSAGSRAVLSVSRLGVLGVIEHAGRRYVIAPLGPAGPGGDGRARSHAIADARTLPQRERDFVCDAEQLALDQPIPGHDTVDSRRLGASSSTRLVCELAVDCDYEYYASKFGSDLGAATAYALTVAAIVSSFYESDLDVAVRVSYLNLWTTESDPYSGASTSAQLEQFRSYWNDNRTTVSRHLAHLISGRNLGGGIANLGVLCDRPEAYAVSQVDAIYSYPTPTATWDVMVIAHEIGHNFNSPHTQNCYWQSAGFVAAGGMLDTCVTSEGGCHPGPFGVLPPGGGTIMSYCHLVAGVANGMQLVFHPACVTLMRAHAEQCLPEGSYDAGITLSGAPVETEVMLAWSASPDPGVIRFDVYRSTVSLDLAPELAGSSTTTTFVDPGRVGTFYYRVRAVRAADQSAYSNEVRFENCLPGASANYLAGTSPVSPASADFNHDGIADLVVANTLNSGTVRVLPGQGSGGVGDGSFGAAIVSPAGTRPVALTVADLDEDGILDVVVANNASTGVVSVLRGQGSGGIGNGTFAAPVAYTVGSSPTALTTGDFNEDGITDLAVTNGISSTVSVLLGQGTGGVASGTFGPATSQSVGSQPTAIGTGDFNEDGILDLAVVKRGARNVSLLIGQGTGGVGNGTFAGPVSTDVGLDASGLAIGDFDADGILDVAVTRTSNINRIGILRGQGGGGVGDGTLGASIEYAAGLNPGIPVATDFNGDGITDLAVTNAGVSSVSLLIGKQSGVGALGSFELPQTFGVLGIASGAVAGDFNQDGNADLAFTTTGNRVSVILGACAGVASNALALVVPNGGESWETGTEQVIQWTKDPGVLSVDIEVSRDGGARWETVARNVTETSHVWSVTDPVSGPDNARIRIFDPTVPGRRDESDLGFEIAPTPVLAVGGDAGGVLRLVGVVPNPTSSGFRVAFTLPASVPGTLDLVDVAGRLVERHEVGRLGVGRHVLELGVERRLASGVYLLRLSQGGRTVGAKAAVVR